MFRAAFDSIDNIVIIILSRLDTFIRFARKADCAAIAEIYNHAVLYAAAIQNNQTVGADNHIAWFEVRTIASYPVLVSERDGVATGYAPFDDWRSFDDFRHTVERSVYVHSDHQGKGLGRKLLNRLVDEAWDCRRHVMVARVESQNQVPSHLHQSLGFAITAQMPQVGTKFGRRPGLTLIQSQLDERTESDVIG